MANQHKIKGTTVRPEPEEVAAAKPHLAGRSMETVLRAVLRAIADKPDETMNFLEPYWPPPKPVGRPRKTHADTEQPGQALVLLTVGDVAHVATALHHHTAPLKVPAARIAEQAELHENELPGRRFSITTLTQDDADGFKLLHDPRR